MSDEIPAVEVYRGVGIEDCQSPERIATVVRPAIDKVLGLAVVDELVRIAGDVRQPPEARLLAAAKCEAAQQIAAAGRVERPSINLQFVRACVAGLGSRRWRSPWAYGSLLDPPPAPGERGPDPRPAEYARQVEEDRQDAGPDPIRG